MTIFLLILKIIGITLLVILGVLLLAVLLVLFVPFRYLIRCDKPEEGDISAAVKVSWLLHLIRVSVIYEGELKYAVKLLFFTLKKSDNLKTEKEIEREKLKEQRKEQQRINKDSKIHKEDNKEKEFEDTAENNIEGKTSPEDNKDTSELCAAANITSDSITNSGINNTGNNSTINTSNDKLQLDVTEDKKTFFDRVVFVLEKIIEFIFGINDKIITILDKIFEVWNNIDYYLDIINDESNKRAVAICLNEVKRILASIRPRKISGYIHIGSEDAYTIGKMMSIYGIIYPLIYDKIQVVPDYDNDVIAGNLEVKGKITVFVLVRIVYMYFFNKDIRHMKKVLKRG